MTNFMKRVASAVLVLAGLAATSAAHASWLGLDDGTYTVTLTGCALLPHCTSDTGTITVSGSGLSFMSFSEEGNLYQGDPIDGVTGDGRENSYIVNDPYNFFDLIGAPADVPSLTLYEYCRNTSSNSCSPDTTGVWTATKVPEPETAGLFALVLAGLVAGRTVRRPS